MYTCAKIHRLNKDCGIKTKCDSGPMEKTDENSENTTASGKFMKYNSHSKTTYNLRQQKDQRKKRQINNPITRTRK